MLAPVLLDINSSEVKDAGPLIQPPSDYAKAEQKYKEFLQQQRDRDRAQPSHSALLDAVLGKDAARESDGEGNLSLSFS